MNFVKNTVITFSTQLITVILGVITSIILARTLGPANFGIYSIITLTITVLGTFGSLGIAISNTYYGVKKEYKWNDIASNSFIAAFILGIILIISFMLVFFFYPSFLKNINTTLIIIAAIATPFTLLMPYFQYILLGQNRIKEFNFTNIIQSALYLSLIIVILFFNNSLQGVLSSWTVSFVIAAIIPVIFVYKSNPFKLHFNFDIFKKTTIFGLKGYLGNVIQFFNYRIDIFLISMILSNYASVGYYSISVALAESLWYLPGVVGTLVFARTPGLTDEDKNRSTPIICRNTFFITLILSIILFITANYIILILYGPTYLPAVKPLWVLLPGVIALSVCKVLSNEIAGRGKPMINTYAAIISLAVNIPLNLLFIPQLGIIGSALASSIAYFVSAIIVLVSFLKISGNSISDTLIIKKGDITYLKDLTCINKKM
jgi:O-antigen/teichoic acid export membrane protein